MDLLSQWVKTLIIIFLYFKLLTSYALHFIIFFICINFRKRVMMIYSLIKATWSLSMKKSPPKAWFFSNKFFLPKVNPLPLLLLLLLSFKATWNLAHHFQRVVMYCLLIITILLNHVTLKTPSLKAWHKAIALSQRRSHEQGHEFTYWPREKGERNWIRASWHFQPPFLGLKRYDLCLIIGQFMLVLTWQFPGYFL